MEMVALRGYSESGSAQELMVKCGLTPEKVEKAAQKALERKRC
jgi:transketolase